MRTKIVRQFSGGKRFLHPSGWRNEVKHAVHVPGMDAVLARCETEEGTESNDLLLQQAETEKRQTDGRNAQEPQGRREQAHRPSVLAKGLSPPLATPYAEASRAGPRPFPSFSEASLPPHGDRLNPNGTSLALARMRRAMPEGTIACDVTPPIE